jgi:glycerol uptake facilitator-like aquaporin
LGFLVGLVVGFLVGLVVGFVVGVRVGDTVGVAVGVAVGVSVGWGSVWSMRSRNDTCASPSTACAPARFHWSRPGPIPFSNASSNDVWLYAIAPTS